MNRKVLNVKDPVWGNPDHTCVHCTVQFEITEDMHPRIQEILSSPVPFTADPRDPEVHGRKLFGELKAGKWGTVAEYVAPPPPQRKLTVEIPGQ